METRISECNGASLREARERIAAGEVVAFPTETVYGLGANAFSDTAVRRIFSLKGRPADNPLIVHVHRDYDISPLVDAVPSYTVKLREAFLPGPLTMVYPSTGKVSRLVSAGLNTLAIRVPSHAAAQAFLRAVELPIAAPSANVSKHVSPVTAEHVFDDFNGKIPLILDGGTCSGGIESTVLDCTGEIPVILRAGLVTRERIESVVGACGVYTPKTGEKPKSPGMAYRHYCPKCRTALFSANELDRAVALYREEERTGVPYLFAESAVCRKWKGMNVLDLGGTPEEMARRLYLLLREGERRATLLIAVMPTASGGVMDGFFNRFLRAFGGGV